MKELKKHTVEYYDYLEMVDHIENKYGINTRDYAGWSKALSDRSERGKKKLFEGTGKSYDDWVKELGQSNDKWKELNSLYFNEPKIEVPYQDFWHSMLEGTFCEFHKGAPIHLNWKEILDYEEQAWVREILHLFVHEFGDEDYTVVVDW